MADETEPIPVFLETTVPFSDGQSFELLKPLTNYRSCHDGMPSEARIVFTCRRIQPEKSDEEFIMKIKVQLPAQNQEPVEGPSTTTAHELKALQIFKDCNSEFAPHLVGFHRQSQGDQCPFPGGFLTFTVMTKMPGNALFGKYWGWTPQQREEVVPHAIRALRAAYAAGIEPIDRGLRNVIWEPESKHCSIIDFELWNETEKTFADEKLELQRWGLIRTPPAKDHWAAWNQMYR